MGATLMDIVLRASIMFVVLYLLLRLLGKRELSQMTPFEFVVLVVMGDLIQQGVTQNDFSVTGATLAIVTFAFWGLLLSWVRSEEHTSELQSLMRISYAVFCLKKKKNKKQISRN